MRCYRFLQLRTELGSINACLYIINRCCKIINIPVFLVKYYFVSQVFHHKPLLPENRGKKLAIKDLPVSYQDKHPCPRPLDVIKDRYKQGAKCLAVYKQDEFAGCFWYVKKQYLEDEVRCVFELLDDDAVWDFDVYVEPKFRLSPVFLKLWDYASQKLLLDGYHRSISRISAFNSMSLSSHKRMGAMPLGWAFFLCIGSVQFMLSSLFPYVHLSFNIKYFPVFKIKTTSDCIFLEFYERTKHRIYLRKICY